MKHEARVFDMASQIKQQEIMQKRNNKINISPFPKERVCMHDSLASERARKERDGVITTKNRN